MQTIKVSCTLTTRPWRTCKLVGGGQSMSRVNKAIILFQIKMNYESFCFVFLFFLSFLYSRIFILSSFILVYLKILINC